MLGIEHYTETTAKCWWCKSLIRLPLNPALPYPRKISRGYVCSYDCMWEYHEHYK